MGVEDWNDEWDRWYIYLYEEMGQLDGEERRDKEGATKERVKMKREKNVEK